MKILMTTDTVGGVWTYAVELALALAPYHVEITLATMGAPLSPRQRVEAGGVPGLRVHESGYRLEWMSEPWDDVRRAGDWLLGLEGRYRPDLVHLNGYAHGALPWRAPVLMVGHSCVLSWWEAVKGEPAPPEWDRYCAEVTRGLRGAGLVVAPSWAMLACLERHYGGLRRTAVVPNGRDAGCFPPAAKEPFILSAGRLWDEAKNVAALAAVAPRLAWPVAVAGEDQHPEGGSAALACLRPLGRLAPRELAEWMGRAAVYALPARYEPFGLSALEAGLAGCALVLGEIPTLREVWADGAVFVPPEDPEALHGALTRLIEEPKERSRLGARARARALEYTPRRMAGAYMHAYRSLVGEGRFRVQGPESALPHPPLGTPNRELRTPNAERRTTAEEEEPSCVS
jgi:glycogen synthase